MTDQFTQGNLLGLRSTNHCGGSRSPAGPGCGRRLRTQSSRDRGFGLKCWVAMVGTSSSSSLRGSAWWKTSMAAQPELVTGARSAGVVTRVTEYTLSVLPEDDVNAHTYEVQVAYRGAGRWAVTHYGYCLSSTGDWDFERQPSSRGDQWLGRHRFGLETALRLAEAAAPHVTVNGKKAMDLLHG